MSLAFKSRSDAVMSDIAGGDARGGGGGGGARAAISEAGWRRLVPGGWRLTGDSRFSLNLVRVCGGSMFAR